MLASWKNQADRATLRARCWVDEDIGDSWGEETVLQIDVDASQILLVNEQQMFEEESIDCC